MGSVGSYMMSRSRRSNKAFCVLCMNITADIFKLSLPFKDDTKHVLYIVLHN